jgi:hypothetical protein
MFTSLVSAKAADEVMQEIICTFQKAQSDIRQLAVECNDQSVIEIRIKKLQVRVCDIFSSIHHLLSGARDLLSKLGRVITVATDVMCTMFYLTAWSE